MEGKTRSQKIANMPQLLRLSSHELGRADCAAHYSPLSSVLKHKPDNLLVTTITFFLFFFFFSTHLCIQASTNLASMIRQASVTKPSQKIDDCYYLKYLRFPFCVRR